MESWLSELIAKEKLPAAFVRTVDTIHRPIANWITEVASTRSRTTIMGLCGPQGSGKSTMVTALQALLADRGHRAAILSLDDLYLTRAERERLAATVHPLLRTRGVPGTHDVALGLAVLDSLSRPGETRVPRFDKALDDRQPPEAWEPVQGPVDVVLFEGWCVGARPQPEAALSAPVNDLERNEDPDAHWRRYVNDALAGSYQRLFARIDKLVMLAPPSFDVVVGWRTEQEQKLRQAMQAGGEAPRGMSDADIARFVAHYERLTRHILAEMPARADVVIGLDEHRQATNLRLR